MPFGTCQQSETSLDIGFLLFFFANVCAQSFYRPSPIGGQRVLYTGGPHGLLSYFITNAVAGIIFWFFKLQAGPSVTPMMKEQKCLCYLYNVTWLKCCNHYIEGNYLVASLISVLLNTI